MASRVGPAVIATLRPTKSCCVAKCWQSAVKISDGSDIRPAPTSPHACSPLFGPMVWIPRDKSAVRFCCVMLWRYICWFIAGASKIGALVARQIVESKSFAMPTVKRAIKSALAGAISTASAHFANSICPIASSACGSNRDCATALPEIACKVSGVTNSAAAGVRTTLTCAWALRNKRINSIVL